MVSAPEACECFKYNALVYCHCYLQVDYSKWNTIEGDDDEVDDG
jgi:hypothetical protein